MSSLKSLFNQEFPLGADFVYDKCLLVDQKIRITIKHRKDNKPKCSVCGNRGSSYGTSETREFIFPRLYNLDVVASYTMRRVKCKHCNNVKVESVSWAQGRSKVSIFLQKQLAHYAKHTSIKSVAEILNVGWQDVRHSIENEVNAINKNRDYSNVEAIAIDEIASKKGHKYLTMVYDITKGSEKKLLYVAKDRNAEALYGFFDEIGAEACKAIEHVRSDMWPDYLKVINERIPHANHVLDPFYIVQNLNNSIDKVRNKEARKVVADGYEPALKKTKFILLNQKENLTESQHRIKLDKLLKYNLEITKAYLLKEDFQQLWDFETIESAREFLENWIDEAKSSKIKPMMKEAETINTHKEKILNWFKDEKQQSLGAVKELNSKAKTLFTNAYGFRTDKMAMTRLHHVIGENSWEK